MAIDLDLEPKGSRMHASLKKLSGDKSVPNTFIAGKHFGGCKETLEGLRTGKFYLKIGEAERAAKGEPPLDHGVKTLYKETPYGNVTLSFGSKPS